MRILTFCLLSLLAVACAPPSVHVEGTFPLTVGPGGGTLHGDADAGMGEVTLEIPAGALDKEVLVDAALTDDPTPLRSPTSTFVGPQIALLPDATAFKKPVTITVPLTPSDTADFGQTAADCKVWVRDADSWTQKPAVANGETTVTVEIDALATVGAGVNFSVVQTMLPKVLPCIDPSGYCLSTLAEPLRSGAKPATISEVTNNKFYYVRVQTGPKFTVVEYDLTTGTNTRETQALVGAGGGTPYEQMISLAPDGSVHASIPGLGLVRFPFSGLPSFGGSSTGVDQAHRSDGTLVSFRVGTFVDSDGKDYSNIFIDGFLAESRNRGARVRLAAHPVDNAIVAFLGHDGPVVLFANGATYNKSYFNPMTTEVVIGVGDDEFALSADGSKVAYTVDAPSPLLRIITRSGLGVGASTLPTLVDMAFSTDDFLYAITGNTPSVFHLSTSAPVAIESIDLSETGVPDTDRLPQAIRRLPNRQMLVVTGATALKVMKIRPSP